MNLFAFQCFWTLAKAQQQTRIKSQQPRQGEKIIRKFARSSTSLPSPCPATRRRLARNRAKPFITVNFISDSSVLAEFIFQLYKNFHVQHFLPPFRRNHGLLAAALSLSAELFRVVFFHLNFPENFELFLPPHSMPVFPSLQRTNRASAWHRSRNRTHSTIGTTTTEEANVSEKRTEEEANELRMRNGKVMQWKEKHKNQTHNKRRVECA